MTNQEILKMIGEIQKIAFHMRVTEQNIVPTGEILKRTQYLLDTVSNDANIPIEYERGSNNVNN